MTYYHLAFGAYWIAVGGILLWGFILERRFALYLSREHPGKWRTLLESEGGRPSLNWPGERMTTSRFLWSCTEDFGDPRVKAFRSGLRQTRCLLVGFFVGGLVGFGSYFFWGVDR